MSFFNNPQEVLFNMGDFNGTTLPTTTPTIITEPATSTEVPQESKTLPKVEDVTTQTGTEDLSLSMDGLIFKEELPIEEEVVSPYIEFANHIGEAIFGGPMEPYEGFDPEGEPTLEVVTNLISHNLELEREKTLERFFDSVTPLTQRIISYDVDSKGQDVDQYIRTLGEAQSIKSLNIENELDQDRIIRTWYQKEGWDTIEIDDKIGELKQAGLLSKEAGRIKPKLDIAAEEIAKVKEEEKRREREIETQHRDAYLQRVEKVLSKDKIGALQFSKEELKELGSALVSDNTEIPLPNGKKITMPYIEAVIYAHRYSNRLPTENLVLATFLLTQPEKFEEKYRKMIETKVNNEVIKDIKYDNQKKSGQINVVDKGKKEMVKETPWKLKTN